MIPKDMVCSACSSNEWLLSRSEAMKIITGWKEDKKAIGDESWDEILNFCTNCGGWGHIDTWHWMVAHFGESDCLMKQIKLGHRLISQRMKRQTSQKVAHKAKKAHRDEWFSNGGSGSYLLKRHSQGHITWKEYQERKRQHYIGVRVGFMKEQLALDLERLRLKLESAIEGVESA